MKFFLAHFVLHVPLIVVAAGAAAAATAPADSVEFLLYFIYTFFVVVAVSLIFSFCVSCASRCLDCKPPPHVLGDVYARQDFRTFVLWQMT